MHAALTNAMVLAACVSLQWCRRLADWLLLEALPGEPALAQQAGVRDLLLLLWLALPAVAWVGHRPGCLV